MISTRWLANLNQGGSNFPYSFSNSYKYLIHCQSQHSRALKWSYTFPPQLC